MTREASELRQAVDALLDDEQQMLQLGTGSEEVRRRLLTIRSEIAGAAAEGALPALGARLTAVREDIRRIILVQSIAVQRAQAESLVEAQAFMVGDLVWYGEIPCTVRIVGGTVQGNVSLTRYDGYEDKGHLPHRVRRLQRDNGEEAARWDRVAQAWSDAGAVLSKALTDEETIRAWCQEMVLRERCAKVLQEQVRSLQTGTGAADPAPLIIARLAEMIAARPKVFRQLVLKDARQPREIEGRAEVVVNRWLADAASAVFGELKNTKSGDEDADDPPRRPRPKR